MTQKAKVVIVLGIFCIASIVHTERRSARRALVEGNTESRMILVQKLAFVAVPVHRRSGTERLMQKSFGQTSEQTKNDDGDEQVAHFPKQTLLNNNKQSAVPWVSPCK